MYTIYNILYTDIHIANWTGFYSKETSRPSYIYYTEYWTIYGTIHCMLFSALYCTLYFTWNSTRVKKWQADLALFLRNTFLPASSAFLLNTILFNILYTLLYTVQYKIFTLYLILHCTLYYTLYCVLYCTLYYTLYCWYLRTRAYFLRKTIFPASCLLSGTLFPDKILYNVLYSILWTVLHNILYTVM